MPSSRGFSPAASPVLITCVTGQFPCDIHMGPGLSGIWWQGVPRSVLHGLKYFFLTEVGQHMCPHGASQWLIQAVPAQG